MSMKLDWCFLDVCSLITSNIVLDAFILVNKWVFTNINLSDEANFCIIYVSMYTKLYRMFSYTKIEGSNTLEYGGQPSFIFGGYNSKKW